MTDASRSCVAYATYAPSVHTSVENVDNAPNVWMLTYALNVTGASSVSRFTCVTVVECAWSATARGQ